MKKICKMILSEKFAQTGRNFLSVILLSLVAFSCTEEISNEKALDDFKGKEMEIVFSMNVPAINGTSSLFRSIGEAQENTIKTIDLVAFRKENTGSYFNYYYSGILTSDNTPGATTQNCRVKVRMADYAQELVIITNAGTLVSDLVNSKSWNNTPKDDFLANLEYALPKAGDSWNAVNASNYDVLPMWGETGATIDKNTNQLSISLLRMLAKIDVQLDEAKLSQLQSIFKIKSVRLYNTNTSGRIVPNSANVQLSGTTISVTAPTLPATPVKHLGPLVYQDFSTPGAPDVAMKGAIYTFETEAPDDNYSLSTLEATCVVVGGIYSSDGKETFYRIDFLKDGNYDNILRNHRYLVNIVSVTGRGYSTPDEAFHNKPVNMDVDILIWDESHMYDVTFDGQWYLSVSNDNIFVPRTEEVNTELSVLTDYNPLQSSTTGWYVESITYSATEAPAEWLDVSPMSGKPNELRNIKLITEDNDSGKDRVAKIVFAAGRLRYPVTVTQTLIDRPSIAVNFWYDFGGNPYISDPVPGELVFEIKPGERNFSKDIIITVTPPTIDILINRRNIPGVKYGLFDFSPNITGLMTTDIHGRYQMSIAPNAVVYQSDIDAEPNYLRAQELIIEATNPPYEIQKSIILKHEYKPK